MPTHRLASIAAAAVIALLPLLGSALADPGNPKPPCAPADRAPLPPGPLVGHPVEAGFSLSWKDPLNLALDVGVDHYQVFRVGLTPPIRVSLEPIAEVTSDLHEFVDQGVREGDYLYWVAAHNCQGSSTASNPVATTLPLCTDSDLNAQGQPPVSHAWVDTSCSTGGPPCNVHVATRPPYFYMVGCAVAG
ncbi:MAG: hypothetical protein QOI63_939 [Thermoplasmata archaeon]|jgi:hypothetical protein|nr:hypothetical protein [Thermoplasmata archaeon]